MLPYFGGRFTIYGMAKPFLTVSEQIEKLRENGLIVADAEVESVESYLADHNYYRLSGYFRYFQQQPIDGHNRFEPGTEWGQVRDAHDYDALLASVLRKGLASIEVVFRSHFAYLLAQSAGPLGYLAESTYDDTSSGARAKLLKDVAEDVRRSSERFVQHHDHLGESLPVWAAVETLSFGTTSRMYGLVSDSSGVYKPLAQRFNVSARASRPVFRAMVVLRNVCTHHNRIWNRTHGILVDTPPASRTESDKAIYSNTPWAWCTTVTHLADAANGDDSYSNWFWDALDQFPDWFVDGLTHPSDK